MDENYAPGAMACSPSSQQTFDEKPKSSLHPFYLKLIYIQPILTILWMVKA